MNIATHLDHYSILSYSLLIKEIVKKGHLMKFNIGICDDESIQRQYLTQVVNEWATQNHYQITIQQFESAESFLFHYEEEKDYDILLLDIEMNQMNGVTLAKAIRKHNEIVQIVFITGYTEYISDGYDVAALQYLIKPVKEDKLFETLHRAVAKIHKHEKCLKVEVNGEMNIIPLFEIKYIEVRQNYITIHAKEETTLKRTLSEIEKELTSNFYRSGRSFIINLDCITRVSKSQVILRSGEVIPLPRGAYDSLNKAIIAHT